MIVSSYCCHCRKVQDFTIRKNVGPALCPEYGEEPLFTPETAPGYVVRGHCHVYHQSRRRGVGRVTKEIVIPIGKREWLW